MFIRFHGNYSSPKTKQPYGIFTVIWHLHRDGKMSEEDSRLYLETNEWFERHLPNPPYYAEGNFVRAVTWFKDNDGGAEMIAALVPLFRLAEKYGVEIVQSVTTDPGTIIYEDEYQVGVIM